jgi:hypothetical protein
LFLLFFEINIKDQMLKTLKINKEGLEDIERSFKTMFRPSKFAHRVTKNAMNAANEQLLLPVLLGSLQMIAGTANKRYLFTSSDP